MEHRWGMRRTLSVGVRLYTGHSPPKFGRLLNASASGAYVAISAMPSIMARVQIALGWDSLQPDGRHRITAYVVRTDGRGIAIEWQDFAPPPVVALFRALDAPPTRTRAARLGRQRAYSISAQLQKRRDAACTYDSVRNDL